MPARQVKSLIPPKRGYGHREHRSKKAQLGLNTRRLREQRIMKKGLARRKKKWRFSQKVLY